MIIKEHKAESRHRQASLQKTINWIQIVCLGEEKQMKMGMRIVTGAVALATLAASAAEGVTLDFQLLTWDTTKATASLPTAVGVTPGPDWLVYTGDDMAASGGNPAGALSHNLVSLIHTDGPAYNLAPSLSGTLSLNLEPTVTGRWQVDVTAMAYAGQVSAALSMNQFLVTPTGPAATNPAIDVDGIGNAGQWLPHGGWGIEYDIDFYFAANVDGDPSPADVDLAFNNKTQRGYLLPVSELTPTGVAALTDPTGFFGGDFGTYLLDVVAPRLPADATYLLITQMDKVHPDFAAPGLPLTTAGSVGNTTIAYTTTPIPEPATGALLAGGAMLIRRRRARA